MGNLSDQICILSLACYPNNFRHWQLLTIKLPPSQGRDQASSFKTALNSPNQQRLGERPEFGQ
ncbi:hypothetical protein PQR39_16330, partial [Paraburkholderia sediminicola]|uniref:hypothetical protein n=1 Tax=Paraburkholderia sediminicola TaxID=458836 RepID=UPI0038BDB420